MRVVAFGRKGQSMDSIVSEGLLTWLLGVRIAGVADLIAVVCLAGALAVVLMRSSGIVRRQNVQLDLQETELALQRGALAAHAMVNISDADGRITYVNDNLAETTGFSAAELMGKRARDMLLIDHAGDFGGVGAELQAGRTWTGESLLRRKDGGFLWTRTTIVPQLDHDGRLVKSVSLRTDITESKLRQEEGPIRAMFDRLQDEVYVFAVDSLKLHYLNKRARTFYGWSETEYRDRTIGDTTQEFNEQRFRDRTRPLVDGDIDAVIYESELDGRPVEINLQLEKGCDGCPRFIAVVRDIAQRKEVEQARGAFVATVSHELRAPLTSVKGSLKLIASGATGEIPAKAGAMVGLALRNVDRLIVLINDLLDLEKLDAERGAIRRAPVDLPGLVAEAVADNAGYGEEFGVTLRAAGLPTALEVSGDRDRLLQVLTNLLSNAVKFSHHGGVVEIGLEDHSLAARITVTDHGIGIPAEAQSQLFERFAQADTPAHRLRGGTGLGLSIVKTIVEKHGGAITFVSPPEGGTTFHVDLPKRAAVQADAHEAA